MKTFNFLSANAGLVIERIEMVTAVRILFMSGLLGMFESPSD
jgi:hypothetical protein